MYIYRVCAYTIYFSTCFKNINNTRKSHAVFYSNFETLKRVICRKILSYKWFRTMKYSAAKSI